MKKLLFLLVIISISFLNCEWSKNNLSQATQKDTTAPTINITSPAENSTFGPGFIAIQGSATDDLKIEKVEYKLNTGDYSEANNQGFSVNSKSVNWIVYLDTSSLASGSHTVAIKATDQWEHTSTASINFLIDKVNPIIVINNGETNTLGTNSDLAVYSPDAIEMSFSNDYAIWSTWESYTISKNDWQLESGAGTKTVYVKFRDLSLNETVTSDTISIYTVPPSLIATEIDTGGGWSPDATISITESIPCAEEARHKKTVSNSWTEWETYTGILTIYLKINPVTVEFKDARENIVSTQVSY
ncbi:MAG: hypothetical protein GY754_12910 [bacterium]|nr:hypothetical protein [bacterium]